MQERCNSIANAMQLHLSCNNPSIWYTSNFKERKTNFPLNLSYDQSVLGKWFPNPLAPFSIHLCLVGRDQWADYSVPTWNNDCFNGSDKWVEMLIQLKAEYSRITRSIPYSTTICKLVDLIPALHQSDCRISNWVSAKTVLSSSTNHGQTTARFQSFFR